MLAQSATCDVTQSGALTETPLVAKPELKQHEYAQRFRNGGGGSYAQSCWCVDTLASALRHVQVHQFDCNIFARRRSAAISYRYDVVTARLCAAERAANSHDGEVEALLERISEGTQASERHESMEALKGRLMGSDQAVQAFASMGVPVMCAVLRDDQEDADLVQVCLVS